MKRKVLKARGGLPRYPNSQQQLIKAKQINMFAPNEYQQIPIYQSPPIRVPIMPKPPKVKRKARKEAAVEELFDRDGEDLNGLNYQAKTENRRDLRSQSPADIALSH